MTKQACKADRNQQLLALMSRSALLAGMGQEYLRELVARGIRRSFGSGQSVFRQGDPARGLYIVLRGRLKVFKLSPTGREQILMMMGPGEPVGEVAVLSGEAYPANAEAVEDSETLYVPREVFLELVKKEPELALRLLGALSARLRSFATLIEDLALKDVAQRLAAYLLTLAEAGSGAAEEDGGRVSRVHLPLSKTQLSATVGTVPETLSRAFRQLGEAGIIEAQGRVVHIKDWVFLERLAGRALSPGTRSAEG